jgi:hypothetical protein
MYFTDAGPDSGPILWSDVSDGIEVLRTPGDHPAIGRAIPVGWTEGGIALWELTVGNDALPGRWLVLGRQFLPAPDTGPGTSKALRAAPS